MANIRELLKRPGPVIFDGATGTALAPFIKEAGSPSCLLNLTDDGREKVMAHYENWVESGSKAFLTNTFNANSWRLKLANMNDPNTLWEANYNAAKDAVTVAGIEHCAVGDIGPSGLQVREDMEEKLLVASARRQNIHTDKISNLNEYPTAESLIPGFKLQASALIEGGVRDILIETMSSIHELGAANRAVHLAINDLKLNNKLSPDEQVSIMATMSFDAGNALRPSTFNGNTPIDFIDATYSLGFVARGANCGNNAYGLHQILLILRDLQKINPTDKPKRIMPDLGPEFFIIKPNAGKPEMTASGPTYTISPKEMATIAVMTWEAGAKIIGGCCGTTYADIAAMANALAKR